jgi:hypothetical protein
VSTDRAAASKATEANDNIVSLTNRLAQLRGKSNLAHADDEIVRNVLGKCQICNNKVVPSAAFRDQLRINSTSSHYVETLSSKKPELRTTNMYIISHSLLQIATHCCASIAK